MGDNSLDYDTAKKYMDSARSGLRLARSYLSNLERVLGRSVKINSGVIYLLGEFHPDNLMWIGDLAYNLTAHTNLAALLARQRMNIVVNSEQLGKDCYDVANQIIERQVEILGKLCPDVGYVEGTGDDHAFSQYNRSDGRCSVVYLDEGNPHYRPGDSLHPETEAKREAFWADKIKPNYRPEAISVLKAGYAHTKNEYGLVTRLEEVVGCDRVRVIW